MKYIVKPDNDRVQGLLDSLRDGSGEHYTALPGCEVTIDSETGTFRFSAMTFVSGPLAVTGEVTIKNWGNVIAFVAKQATTPQERRLIAERFINFGKKNDITRLKDEDWIKDLVQSLE